jgi:hypothetical protein
MTEVFQLMCPKHPMGGMKFVEGGIVNGVMVEGKRTCAVCGKPFIRMPREQFLKLHAVQENVGMKTDNKEDCAKSVIVFLEELKLSYKDMRKVFSCAYGFAKNEKFPNVKMPAKKSRKMHNVDKQAYAHAVMIILKEKQIPFANMRKVSSNAYNMCKELADAER